MRGIHVERHGRRGWLVAAPLVALALLVSACGSSSDDKSSGGSSGGSAQASSGGGSGSAKGKRAVFITCDATETSWCSKFNPSVEAAMKKAGVQLTVLQDNQDAAVQAQHMNQAIAQRPDVIFLQVDDENSIVPSLLRAKTAKIPVIVWNGPVSADHEDLVTASVLVDHPALGKFSAQTLVEGMKKNGYDKGNVIVLNGTASMPIVKQRTKAFYDYMKQYPQYKIVADEDTNWDPNASAKTATELISKFNSKGGIQGVITANDDMAVPTISAIEQLGKTVGHKEGDILLVGQNCSAAGVKSIIAGKEYGTGTESPIPTAIGIAEHVIDFLSGKQVDKVVMLPQDRVTPDNAEKFTTPDECDY